MSESMILHEANFRCPSWATRVVRLSGDYSQSIAEMIATITSRQVTITTFRTAKKAHRTVFTPGEMDALCSAWTQYNADEAAYNVAEQARQAVVIATAQALAKTVPALHLDGTEGYWVVTVPAIDWGNPGYAVHTADLLLARVQEASNALRAKVIYWLEFKDTQQAAWASDRYQEAHALLAEYGYLASQDEIAIDYDYDE